MRLAVIGLLLFAALLTFVLGCGGGYHELPYSPAEVRVEDLGFDHDSPNYCPMEVEITNDHAAACNIYFAAELTFTDGSHEGYGFVFFSDVGPGESREGYGDTGDIRSGRRTYPSDCSELAALRPLYVWQDCADGFYGVSGNRERYNELTSVPTG